MVLSFRTDSSGQTVYTHSVYLDHLLLSDALLNAKATYLVQILGWLQLFLRVSEFLEVLR